MKNKGGSAKYRLSIENKAFVTQAVDLNTTMDVQLNISFDPWVGIPQGMSKTE